MARPDLTRELIDRLRNAVADAATSDDAAERIAKVMPGDVRVSRVGFRVLDPGREEVLIVGVWSDLPTELRSSLTHPITGTISDSFLSVVKAGTSSIRIVGRDRIAPPFLQDLLAEEGNASVVLVPLATQGQVTGVLAIFSALEDAFVTADVPFFDVLGESLADALRSLAPGPGG